MTLLTSKRFWLALVLVTAIYWLKSSPYLITAGALILLGITFADTVRPLRFLRFWLAIILLVVIVPVFAGLQDSSFLGISYSSEKLAQTTLMALRGIVIFLLVQVLTVNLDSEKFAGYLSKYGGKNFTTLYDLSREIIPNARHILNSRFRDRDWRLFNIFHPGKVLDRVGNLFADLIRLARRLENPFRPRMAADPSAVIEKLRLMEQPVLVIVTGGPGSGKTSWLEQLYQELQNNKINADGILTRRKYITADKWQLEMVEMVAGETRVAGKMEPIMLGVETENYYMDPAVMAWGSQHLSRLRTDWLLVDEVGIFEFNYQGFYPALKELDSIFRGKLIIGLRKSLLVELDDFLAANLPQIHSWRRYYVLLDEA